MGWTAGVDRAFLYVITESNWNDLLGATGSLNYLKDSPTFDGSIVVTKGLIVNESGGDFDTRIEGLNKPNLFFVDAGNDRVGINIAASLDAQLHVLAGATTTVGLVVEALASASVATQQWHYNETISAQLSLKAGETILELGGRNLGNNIPGPKMMVSRNVNAGAEGPAAGSLMLERYSGVDRYFWADDNNLLRTHSTPPTGSSGSPTVADTAGSVCGDQSAWHTWNNSTSIIASNLQVNGTGPHVFGTAPLDYYQIRIGGSFTSQGGSTKAAALNIETSLIAATNDTTFQSIMRIGDCTITTQNDSKTIGVLSSLYLNEPGIQKGNDTVTLAATLYIATAPTEGATNAALYVAVGSSILRGNLKVGAADTIDGQCHILAGSTSTVGLVVEALGSASVDCQQWHYNGTEAIDIVLNATTTSIRTIARDLGNDVKGTGLELTRNTNDGAEGPAAAYILMQTASASRFLWIDNTNDLRTHNVAPTGSSGSPTVIDTIGTVVGSQSSPKAIKNIIHEWKDGDAYKALTQILKTPVYDFTYKDGQRKGQFTGIAIENGDNPWYGMDPAPKNDYVPEGTAKALNEVNIAGYMILGFRAMQQEIDTLRSKVKQLEAN